MEEEKRRGISARKLWISIFVGVAVGLVAGILIGHYAINSAPSADPTPATTMSTTTQRIQSSPIVVHLWNAYGTNVSDAAWNGLKNGRLNAVLAGVTEAEVYPTENSVGIGSNHDENGEITLDAMIMDAETHSVGAVGGLRRVLNAVGVAAYVMNHTYHTLLVGDSATTFAEEMGFTQQLLSDQRTVNGYASYLARNCTPTQRKNVSPDPEFSCGPYTPLPPGEQTPPVEQEVDEDNHDTVGVMALDWEGKIAVATSTNGMRGKVPGRVGDTPIPGAGGYADKEVGACAATGNGDIMVRFLPCYHAIMGIKSGKTVKQAATDAMELIESFTGTYVGGIVILSKDGTVDGACKNFRVSYVVRDDSGMRTATLDC